MTRRSFLAALAAFGTAVGLRKVEPLAAPVRNEFCENYNGRASSTLKFHRTSNGNFGFEDNAVGFSEPYCTGNCIIYMTADGNLVVMDDKGNIRTIAAV